MRQRCAPAAPDVDREEQEEPDHVDEMPVPRRRLEAEMLLGSEIALQRTDEADEQEDRADKDVEAVEAGRHEEGGAVDRVLEGKGGMGIFIGLDTRKQDAEQDGQR